MGSFPKERVSFSRPFTYTGINYAGPFDIQNYIGRACLITKGYVLVFVCFSTRAVHLEPTSDLTTEKFLAAFARFVSRRGCPRQVQSDNGKTFVGASTVLSVTDAYSDSTIVLAWLAKPACHWTTFVANRVTKITESTEAANWSHVQSKHNPADLASREVPLQELVDNPLWWHGPTWLQRPRDHWPSQRTDLPVTEIEKRAVKVHVASMPTEDFLDRFSNLDRALWVLACPSICPTMSKTITAFRGPSRGPGHCRRGRTHDNLHSAQVFF